MRAAPSPSLNPAAAAAGAIGCCCLPVRWADCRLAEAEAVGLGVGAGTRAGAGAAVMSSAKTRPLAATPELARPARAAGVPLERGAAAAAGCCSSVMKEEPEEEET